MKDKRFPLGAGLLLGFVLVLLGVDIAQLSYRLIQPSDGWKIFSDPDGAVGFDSIMQGEGGQIQPGDVLLAVEGIKLDDLSLDIRFTDLRPAGWQVGQVQTYTIRRDDAEMDVDVTLVRWEFKAFSTYILDPFNFTAVLFFGIGCYTFLRRPGDWGARALFLFSASLLGANLSGIIDQTTDVLLPTWGLTIFFSYIIFGTLMIPSLFILTLSFPKPKRFFARWHLPTLAGVYGLTPLLMLITGNNAIGWTTVLGFAALSLVAVLHSALTVKDPVSRLQIRWAVSGVVIAAVALILNNLVVLYWQDSPVWENLPAFIGELPTTIAFLALGLGFSIAILRYRLFDIDIIIRKTLVYALLTGLLSLVYFGGVALLQALLSGAEAQSSPIVIVLTTLLIAALFNPLRRRIQDFIDRRFYRQKYDAEKALAGFTNAAQFETDLENLIERLVYVVQDTMQPLGVSFWSIKEREREKRW